MRTDDLYLKVRDIVNDVDPMHLVWIAGENEYTPEIMDILDGLADCKNSLDAQNLSIQTFEKWFGDGLPTKSYERIGKRVWALWVRVRSNID